MEPNDSTTVSTESTEEKGTEGVEDSSNDLAELKELIQNQQSDIASLKRSLKKATKETRSDTPTKNQTSDDSDLSQKVDKMALRIAGITEKDEVDLFNRLKEETGKTADELLETKYFQAELQDLRDQRSNADAATNVSGDKTKASAKDSVDYWLAKGEPPTPDQLPDRKKRAEIIRAFMKKGSSNGKTFYND